MKALRIRPGVPLRGEVEAPGDKSISHRALILGALAEGTSEVLAPLWGEDCLATARALEALGVRIEGRGEARAHVHGVGFAGLREPGDVLDAGNSGTTIRLLAGVLAPCPFFSVLTGDASLRRRPMGRVLEPLRDMGASLWGRGGGQYPPLAIRGGPLRGLRHVLPVASAQVKSAILLAGLAARGETEVIEPAPSRDHTERMLPLFGVAVSRDGGRAGVVGGARLRPARVAVPGDFSSAAFLLVAALIVPGSDLTIRRVGVNPTRTGLLEILRAMGAAIEVRDLREEAGEPVADLRARFGPLCAAEVAGPLVPRLIDELPAFAVAAACAEGESVVGAAAELRVKEVDRIAAVAGELGKLGARIAEVPDGFRIRGGTPLVGARCASRGDHRMAMALAVAALAADGETTVLDVDCIETSFPGFAATLDRVAPGAARVESPIAP